MGAKRPGNKFHQEGTYLCTYGHRDSMTESAPWADSAKISSQLPHSYKNLKNHNNCLDFCAPFCSQFMASFMCICNIFIQYNYNSMFIMLYYVSYSFHYIKISLPDVSYLSNQITDMYIIFQNYNHCYDCWHYSVYNTWVFSCNLFIQSKQGSCFQY